MYHPFYLEYRNFPDAIKVEILFPHEEYKYIQPNKRWNFAGILCLCVILAHTHKLLSVYLSAARTYCYSYLNIYAFNFEISIFTFPLTQKHIHNRNIPGNQIFNQPNYVIQIL